MLILSVTWTDVGGGYFANKVSIPEEYCENFFMSGLSVSSQWAFMTFLVVHYHLSEHLLHFIDMKII